MVTSWGNVIPEDGVITEAMVIAERARRLALGFAYNFEDDRGVHQIGTTIADMTSWDEVTKLSTALISAGAPETLLKIRTDTGPVEVTALEWQHILIRAGLVRQPLFDASFDLQERTPIPVDYCNDSYWA